MANQRKALRKEAMTSGLFQFSGVIFVAENGDGPVQVEEDHLMPTELPEPPLPSLRWIMLMRLKLWIARILVRVRKPW